MADLKSKFLKVYSVLKSKLLNDPAFEFSEEATNWIDQLLYSSIFTLKWENPHNSELWGCRVTSSPAQKPNNQRLLEYWKKNGALYSTPQGSNDERFCLYAVGSH
ncbi:hypothetical protein K1719_034833 [Acacia pycnantha]|nr:hypothetical protein K1719_034833 [Acacia pycnantha]